MFVKVAMQFNANLMQSSHLYADSELIKFYIIYDFKDYINCKKLLLKHQLASEKTYLTYGSPAVKITFT